MRIWQCTGYLAGKSRIDAESTLDATAANVVNDTGWREMT